MSTEEHVRESLERLGSPLPRLVAFDLDYTCWPLWVDTHVDAPLKRRGEQLNKVFDRTGQPLSLYPHIGAILFFLQSKGVVVAAASRTSAPSVARQALQNLLLHDHVASKTVKAISLFDQLEIYPGSKIQHFRQLHAKTGVAYEEMVFFDDEHRNAEVSTKLGVHFQLVGDPGTDLATFERAIREWRAKRSARQGDPDAGKGLL